ncbi:MAG TPA: GNAT family protein [Clostridia bacterium]|nr:GNAT family protein [Clostridia bacterium]
MKFNETIVTAKNGTKFTVRSATVDEAAALLDYLNKVSAETDFLLRSADDQTLTLDEEKQFISSGLESPTKYNICVFCGDEIAGTCSLYWSDKKKIAHRGNIGIALLKKYWNLGLGTELFKIMVELGKKYNMTQLELSYVDGNNRGKALYEKMGFCEVGRIPNAFLMNDNSFHDDVIMVKTI